MAEKKELYGYEEDDILTLEFDDGEEKNVGYWVCSTHWARSISL